MKSTTVGNGNSFGFKTLSHIVLVIFALFCFIPLWLIIAASLTHESDLLTDGYSFLPKKLTLVAYQVVLQDPEQIINSYLVTFTATVMGTLIGLWLITTMAYVISRKDYKLRRQISFFIFFTMLFNGGLVPSYILISRWLHMKNTIFVLFVPYLVNPWFVLLMKGFLQNISQSLLESAKIDGASEFKIFISIVIPLAKPAIATVGLFMVLMYWNDWWLSLLYIDREKLYSLQFMLIRILRNLEFLNSDYARNNLDLSLFEIPTRTAQMAMCIIAAGPMLVVFPFFQKYFVKGLTVGSIKG